MRNKKDLKAEPSKKTRTKILKLILLALVVLIVLAFLLFPVFVSSGKGREIILARINNAIDGRTDFASLSMGWFDGIKVADFSFNDNTGSISVDVKHIATKPHYSSILMGSLSLGETVIDEPRVRLSLREPQVSEIPQLKKTAAVKPQLLVLPIERIDLIVNDGNVKVTDSKAGTVELAQINSKVDLRPPGQQTNFDINLAVVSQGKHSQVHTQGRISPVETKTGWTLKGTSGDVAIEVNDLDLESLAPLFTMAGVDVQAKGVVSADIDSRIKDGQLESMNGIVKAKNLDVTLAELQGDRLKTSSLDVDVKVHREVSTIKIDNLSLKSDWAVVNAAGTVPTTLGAFTEFIKPDSAYDLKADFDFDLPAVSSQMPHTLGLKEGMQITSGKLKGDIEKITEAGKKIIQGQATLSGLEGSIDGKTVALLQPIKVETQISSDKTNVKFDKLDVSSSFAKIICSGTAELLNYDAYVDLKQFQTELGQFANIGPYQMAGELSSKGQVSIKEERITAVGSSNIRNFMIASERATASEPAADVAFAFDIDQNNNLVAVDSVKASATLGQVSIKDAVLPLNEKATKSMNLPISADNIDLKKLQQFAVLFASFPKEMQLEGTAESRISISSQKDTYTVTTDLTRIRNLKVSYPQQNPFEQQEVLLAFDAELNPKQKTVNVKRLQLESPQIKITKGEIRQSDKDGRTKLQGSVDCEYDWSVVSTLAGPYLPKGLKLYGKRTDTINFSSEYPAGQPDQIPANLNTKTRLGFEKAEYMGLNFGPTETDIQVQNGLLNIAPFSASVNNGKFNFAATIDLRKKPKVLQTTGPMQIIDKVEINEQVSRNLLENLNPIFKGQTDITGIANFHCEKLAVPLGKDTSTQPEVVGTVGIENMKLETKGLLGMVLSWTKTGKNIDAAVLPTKFILQKGRLSYDNMQINLDKYPTNFGGSIGPNRILDMKVITPYILTMDFKPETVKIGEQTTAERIVLPLTGTIDNPNLDKDKFIEKLIEQQLKQRLRGELEELFR